ncbi:nucleotide sugar dehydrogenase [Amycolatopsis anabasis]|uniref:nucleotide sugar dehydrogenase n=1 Tax=Amycolatopsis anabasis TaxID=1840409 RepID=UPI00131D81BF|nr:nucleotide sugar dehydrogenase [Amycolatopsis anabasis]
MTHPAGQRTGGQVAVVGLGYVGLPLALTLADRGVPVVGVDVDPAVRASVAEGRPKFYEPGLDELLHGEAGSRLTIADRLPPAPLDAVVICVGTAVDPETKRPDLRHLRAAIEHVAEHVGAGTLVVVRSTVPVGTCRRLVYPRLAERVAEPLLAFCPERTIQGQALVELSELPQVIGAIDDRSLARARELFAPVAADQVTVSDLESAELIKLVCNAHTDLIYGFGNEIALMAEALGVDANEVIASANLRYPRPDLSRPGFVGGSCLTKDPYLLRHSAEEAGYRPPMVSAARSVNERVPHVVVEHVLKALAAKGCPPAEAKVLVCGIAYKGRPETDDVRGSAATEVEAALRDRVAVLAGHDFVVADARIAELGFRPASLTDGMTGADALVLLVDHPRYRAEIERAGVLSRMNRPAVVFDLWGLLEDELADVHDIEYRRLGRGR